MEVMNIVKEVAPVVAQGVVTSIVGILTMEASDKVCDKRTVSRLSKLSKEEQNNDEIVKKIIAGEKRKKKVFDTIMVSAEAIGIGVSTAYLTDNLLSDDSVSDDNDTAAADSEQ